MKLSSALTVLTLLLGITVEVCVADFSYNYLELKGDYSGTKNVSHGWSTDDNFNHILKMAVSLRFHF